MSHPRAKVLLAGVTLLIGTFARASLFFHFNPGFASATFKITPDGRFAVGVTDGAVFRWSQQTGAVFVSEADYLHTFTAGVSADGDTIVSTMLNVDSNNEEAAVWHPGQGWTFIGGLAGGGVDNHLSSGNDVSGDGSKVVGLAWHPDYRAEAYVWTQEAGVVGLGKPVGRSSRATAVSRNGETIVGFYENETTAERRPVRWINGGSPDLLLGSTTPGECLGVDTTGSLIVGEHHDLASNRMLAFLYAGNTSRVLGVLPEHETNVFPRSLANAVSDSGTVVGYSGGDSFWGDAEEGFVWTLASGMVSISDYLDSKGLTIPGNLHLNSVTAISADGTTLGGQAFNSTTGLYEAWIAIVTHATTETLAPTSEQILLGSQNSGGNLASWGADDNDARQVCKFFVPNATSPFVRVNLNYTTTKTAPTAISFDVKVSVHTPGPQSITLNMQNKVTTAFVATSVNGAASINGTTYNGVPTGNLADYVGGGGAMTGQVEVRQTGPSTLLLPCCSFEFAQMAVTG